MKIQPFILILLAVTVSCTPRDNLPVMETAVPSSNTTTPFESVTPPSHPAITQTITPVQTCTPYPTFDIENVKTHVPSQPAQCPTDDPNWHPANLPPGTFNIIRFADNVEDELGKDASFSQVKQEFESVLQMPDLMYIEDLTGDGVPELEVREAFNMVVIECFNGEYKTILDYPAGPEGGFSPTVFTVQDMNLNGIPDVVLTYPASTGWNTVVDILEWDGVQFNSFIQANHGENSPTTSNLAAVLYWYFSPFSEWRDSDFGNKPVMNGYADIDIRDLDQNGTKELILTDYGPSHWDTLYNFGPWRGEQVVFKWDGVHYLYSSLEIDPPEYRFQAVQDADRLFLMGEYDQALDLYKDVIFTDTLDWWSPQKMKFLSDSFFAGLSGEATPTPPQSDPDEYLLLAAYARYRILLEDLARDQFIDAHIAYTSLIENYPADNIGFQFADMATILWNEYQKTNNLEQACLPVINYVTSHPEVLSPLGDLDHGLQSHIYNAEDVCPIKQPIQ
jgi:hypothetical protein